MKKQPVSTTCQESAVVEEILSRYCDAHSLTPREKQVFVQACLGSKNFLIATRIGVSEATIRLHITNIHRKLGTGNKVDLLLKAFRWSLAGGYQSIAPLATPAVSENPSTRLRKNR
jgi:DNA-binding NarL/FixJ family response regulator